MNNTKNDQLAKKKKSTTIINYNYTKLAEKIIAIIKLTEKNSNVHTLKTQPLNVQADEIYIASVFLEPTTRKINNKEYAQWEKDEWVLSMQFIKLGLFSFLYKVAGNLMNVYMLSQKKTDRIELFDSYLSLVKSIKSDIKLTETNNAMLSQNIMYDNIAYKESYLILNLKNFKSPKNAAAVIDLLQYKEYRTKIFNSLINGSKAINITELRKYVQKDDMSYFDKIMEFHEKNNLLEKIIMFLMSLNLNADVVVYKKVYNKINDYLTNLFNHSDCLKSYMFKLDEEEKEAGSQYVSNINLKLIDEDVKFEDTYNFSNNINFEKINFEKTYINVFQNDEKIMFSSKDFAARIRHIICLLVEYVTVLRYKTKNEQTESINKIIKNNADLLKPFYEDDEDFAKFAQEIISKGIFQERNSNNTNNQSTNEDEPEKDDITRLNEELFKTTENDILKTNRQELQTLKDLLIASHINMDPESYAEFESYMKEIMEIKKKIATTDFTTIEKEKFTYFSDLSLKLSKRTNSMKMFIGYIINPSFFEMIVSKLESYTFFVLNPKLKEEAIRLFIKAATSWTTALKEEEEKVDPDSPIDESVNKLVTSSGKLIDCGIYYLAKLSNNIKNRNFEEQREVNKMVLRYKVTNGK